MNVFDLFVFIVTAGFAVLGFREGLVRGVIKLAGFVGLVVIVAVFAGRIAALAELVDVLPPHVMAPLMFIVVILSGSIVVHVAALLLYKLVHMTPAGFIDTGLGCALGIFKALLLSSVLALAISFAPPRTFFGDQYRTSVSAPALVSLLEEIIPVAGRMFEPLYRSLPAPLPDADEEEEPHNDANTYI